jgi:hypothetical protein
MEKYLLSSTVPFLALRENQKYHKIDPDLVQHLKSGQTKEDIRG